MMLARIFILALAGFELLNAFGLLHFTLNFSWFGLVVTSLGTFAIIETIYYIFRRKGIILPTFPYFLIAFGLWFDAIGDIGHFYGNYQWYDQVAHLLGGAAVMSVAIAIFSQYREKYKMPMLLMLMVCLAFTALFGDLYEMEEYLEDIWRGQQLRLGDGPDTANDLMWNLLGGASVGTIYILFKKRYNS